MSFSITVQNTDASNLGVLLQRQISGQIDRSQTLPSGVYIPFLKELYTSAYDEPLNQLFGSDHVGVIQYRGVPGYIASLVPGNFGTVYRGTAKSMILPVSLTEVPEGITYELLEIGYIDIYRKMVEAINIGEEVTINIT